MICLSLFLFSTFWVSEMRVAVVGAGLFGSTVSFMLSRDGHSVDLFEEKSEILCRSSRTNQLRLHQGYHYPRSPETVRELRTSVGSFMREYGHVTYRAPKGHFYCISSDNSRTSSEDFLSFCDSMSLPYEVVDSHPAIVSDNVSLTVKCDERLINLSDLRKVVRWKLKADNVNVRLSERFHSDLVDSYDLVVNATYAKINEISPENSQRKYQYELCEKILVRPPEILRGISVVVLDGPFCCIDPFNDSDLSLLGNVVHAVRESSIGFSPPVPGKFSDHIDRGFTITNDLSFFEKFSKSGSEYFKKFSECEYLGSSFTYRVVLPDLDATDARPTVLRWATNKIVNIFSGKLDTCVNVSEQLVKEIR